MDKCLHKNIWLIVMLALVVAGCGRKEAPQPSGDVKPQIVDLKYTVNGSVLRLDFELRGDERGVGFQIDRTRIDPYCKCPGFWRRYVEEPARPKLANRATYKMITLKNDTVDYLFRIRAIDVMGNLGPWSKIIRARGVDLMK